MHPEKKTTFRRIPIIILSIHSSFKHTHLRINHQKYTWRHASFVSLISKSISRWARFGGRRGEREEGRLFSASPRTLLLSAEKLAELNSLKWMKLKWQQMSTFGFANVLRQCTTIDWFVDSLANWTSRWDTGPRFSVNLIGEFIPFYFIRSISNFLIISSHLETWQNTWDLLFFPPQCECEKIA